MADECDHSNEARASESNGDGTKSVEKYCADCGHHLSGWVENE